MWFCRIFDIFLSFYVTWIWSWQNCQLWRFDLQSCTGLIYLEGNWFWLVTGSVSDPQKTSVYPQWFFFWKNWRKKTEGNQLAIMFTWKQPLKWGWLGIDIDCAVTGNFPHREKKKLVLHSVGSWLCNSKLFSYEMKRLWCVIYCVIYSYRILDYVI